MRARVWIFWVLVIALFVYEGYAILTLETGDTISEIVWGLSHLSPIVAFLAGLLSGHFFWQNEMAPKEPALEEEDEIGTEVL